MSPYEIIAYRPELKEPVVELRRYSYDTEFRESREYLEWKYERNPFLGEPIYYLALDGGKVVGMRGFYGTRWESGAARDVIVLPCADDFAVNVEHRNTGVTSLIMRLALDDLARRGFRYAINTSGGRLTVLSSLAMGWKSVGALEPAVRRSRREAVRFGAQRRLRRMPGAWRLLRRSGAVRVPGEEPYRRLDRMGREATRDRGAFVIADCSPRPREMAALIARLPYDGRIRQVRDAAFFEWRFRNPIREYRFLYYEKDGRLDGYLVLARYPEYLLPIVPFHVVDWEGTTDDVREDLLRCAARVGQFPELGVWSATLPASGRSLVTRMGFVPADLELRPRGIPCVLLKKLGTGTEPWILGGASALDPARWDMRMIYSMHG